MIVEAALKYNGVKEFPANSNKVIFNTWIYGKDVFDGDKPGAQYPWCGAFVSKCFADANKPLGNIGLLKGFVGCPYAVERISKWGVQVTKPQRNDVVFHDWNGDGKFDHTSIFIKDLGKGLFQSIEGNAV